jgi:hypothetical protein
MNADCKELVRLYEVMHTCAGSEAERTSATSIFEDAAKASAKKTGIEVKLIIRHIKDCYFKQIRSEDQRTDRRPLITD